MTQLIGFIGLGKMGTPMAANLLAAGYRLRLFNRTPEKAAPLVAQGAQLASDPRDTAEPGGIVITMLADDHAVESVVDGERGIVKGLAPDGIHLSMSTITPATARRLAQEHERHGIRYVAAPVFGRPEAAAGRKLWICVSGPRAAKDRVTPILHALSQGIFDFGEQPEAANVVKLAGNFLLASAIEALAEALTLAEKNGVDRTTLAAMLSQTLFACPAYQIYGDAVARKRDQPVGFRVSLGLKDINSVLQTAEASRLPMPLASLLHDRLLSLVAQGKSDLDWVALASEVARQGGMER
ncbi:MAG TPA: NAD(P)-dependent oxidoreductase [Nitrospira sp.]|nr:NAD(P)-dependent oxidoreductase [Nitrospira sp.]